MVPVILTSGAVLPRQWLIDMSKTFLDILARQPGTVDPEKLVLLAREFDAKARELASLLQRCEASVRQEVQNEFAREVRAYLECVGAPAWNHSEVLTPEFREWALQQFSKEEIAAGLRDIEKTGGRELRDFLPELEQAAGPDG